MESIKHARGLPVISGLAVVLLAGLVPVGAVAQQAASEAVISQWASVRLRTVRLRIEPRALAKPGACLQLGLADLQVSLRGQRLPPGQLIRLERETRPNLHALVIDTSTSMKGKMDWVRKAAGKYVGQLRPGIDRALALTFDDTIVMVQGPTAVPSDLASAIDGLRIGGGTFLNDALYYAIRELDAHHERPVILLVTDADYNVGYHERIEVLRLVRNRPQLTVFTIGLGMPEMSSTGPSGANSTRKFLQKLARRSNGRWFDVPTGSRLEPVFLAIREMLDNEAMLELIDTDPEAEPGRISVSSAEPACKVRVLRQYGDPEPETARLPISPPFEEPPFTLEFPGAPGYAEQYEDEKHLFPDPACRPRNGVPWYIALEGDEIEGCGLDITMDLGRLYSTDSVTRSADNGWIQLQTRPFRFQLVPVAQLPTAPEQLLDQLAQFAASVADFPPAPDDRKLPRHLHARRYSDYPALVHGRIFLESRPRLARALFGWPAYRERVMGKLESRAQRELSELTERFRRLAPGSSEEALTEAALQSERGREILARARQPTESDLMDHVAAWLGDISAHDLFLSWERSHLDRMLETTGYGVTSGSFVEDWNELRKIFFVPSYARTLTLLSPVHDPVHDRIGFWRVVLPRTSWMWLRVQGWKRHPDFKNMPLDLVPEQPYGYLLLTRLMQENPLLAAHLRDRQYRLVDSSYEPLVKPWRQDPRRAFQHLRARLRMVAKGGEGTVELTAEMIREPKSNDYRLLGLQLTSEADPILDGLSRLWEATVGESLGPDVPFRKAAIE